MDNIKERLLNAVEDGTIDGVELVDILLNYITNETVSDIIENQGWQEECGLNMADTED